MNEKDMKRWWLYCIQGGRPTLLEITHVNGSRASEIDAEPDVDVDSRVTVDRALVIQTAVAQNGISVNLSELRMSLGPILSPQADFTKRENRRPLNFYMRSLLIGPYCWIDVESPANQHMVDAIKEAYTPQNQRIVVPPKGTRIPNPPAPGAGNAFGNMHGI